MFPSSSASYWLGSPPQPLPADKVLTLQGPFLTLLDATQDWTPAGAQPDGLVATLTLLAWLWATREKHSPTEHSPVQGPRSQVLSGHQPVCDHWLWSQQDSAQILPFHILPAWSPGPALAASVFLSATWRSHKIHQFGSLVEVPVLS
jgi:hypothetical protein